MGNQLEAAIDTIVASRHAALDELAQIDAAARRVSDAVTRIGTQAAFAQGLAEPPAELTVVAEDAQRLVHQVAGLIRVIGRLDQWGRPA